MKLLLKSKKGQVYYPLLFIFMQVNLEGSEQVFEQQASNKTTLTIDKLENAFEQNENQIDLMQKFIKTKTSEIATLQEYLIGEFQSIQNAKARNKRIEKSIFTQAIPMLKEISLKLRQFKEYFTPFANVATAYFTTLASKAQQLLAKKQEIIDQQASTIQQLQNKLLSYSKVSKHEQHQKSRSIIEQRSQEIYLPGKEWGKSNQNFQMTQKLNKLQRQFTPDCQKPTKVTYQRIQSKQTSKSPIKINKYEECYQHIQQNKKFINYRCERPLSPLQTNIDHRRAQKNKQDYAVGFQRKQCIKQKIQKIKIRTECKEKHTKFAFYENYH